MGANINHRPTLRREAALAAGSAGAIGGLAALMVWELTAAPGVVAAAAGAATALAVHLIGTWTDRLLEDTRSVPSRLMELLPIGRGSTADDDRDGDDRR